MLDAGCGEGVVTERLARALPGVRVVGLDVADPALAAEWQRRQAPGLEFLPGSMYALPFEDRSFDLVCAFEVLEHLGAPGEGLAELRRVARRALVLSVPREPVWRATNVATGRYVPRAGTRPAT